MRNITLILFTLSFPIVSLCQTFQDLAPDWDIVQFNWDGVFGAGVSAADWNRDGWDDLTIGNSDGAIRTFINDGGEGFIMMALPITQQAETKAVQWVDIDGDYDLDFFLSDRYGKMYILENIGDTAFVNVSRLTGLPNVNTESAGSSWGDYDNDGDLDLHICRYAESDFLIEPMYRNVLMRNDGGFNFTNVSSESQIDVYVRFSFQSIWYDWDGDGWQDLYVINDKNGANSLFHNQQNGMFTEIASSVGADLVLDAMTASLGDFNQDGHQDIFITSTVIGNDGIGSQLLVGSENGQYQEASELYGLNFQRFCWGAAWMDVDNDTDLDLFVAESEPLNPFQENYLYKNHGPFVVIPPFSDEESDYYMEPFAESVYALDLLNSNTVVSGDFDRNGWVDFVVHNTGNHKARIWMNSGFNENPPNYIQLGVQGVVSNTMGIGAWVEVTDNELTQRRVIHCGENYLGQESFYEHFGLDLIGDNPEQIDIVKIEWPSGIIDIWTNVVTQDRHIFIEGTSACQNFDNTPINLCETTVETIEIETYWPGANVVWTDENSGGVLGQTNYLPLSSAGNYTASVYFNNTELCSVSIEVTGINSDLNGSGTVDSADFLEFLAEFGCMNSCEADINNDGETNVEDLLQMLVEFGSSC